MSGKKFISQTTKSSRTRIVNERGEVTIPNILLTKARPLEIHLFITDGSGTYIKMRRIVRVLARPKPEDYANHDDNKEIQKWAEKLDINQGAENASKILTVDENGEIVPTNFSPVADDKYYTFSQSSASDAWRKCLYRMVTQEVLELAEDFKMTLHETHLLESNVLVLNCIYRMGCPEFKTCGYMQNFIRWVEENYSGVDWLNDIQTRYDLYNDYFYHSMSKMEDI